MLSERGYTQTQQNRGQRLIDVHDYLRGEVVTVRELIDQVAAGSLDPGAARGMVNRMIIRQNHWTLGAFCERYCAAVTEHHTNEDVGLLPHLQARDEGLGPVIDRLHEEHAVIAAILERVDERLVDLVARGPDALAGLRGAVDLLSDAMKSHLSYEEHELVEPLARLGYGRTG